jgi:hypothetical protein
LDPWSNTHALWTDIQQTQKGTAFLRAALFGHDLSGHQVDQPSFVVNGTNLLVGYKMLRQRLLEPDWH